jgi:hypothetical protein
MIDFPASPIAGTVYTVGGASWRYDGTKWVAVSGPVAAVYAGDVGRNLIHNPMFNIAQRGAGPWAPLGAAMYTLDRWPVYANLDVVSFTQAALTDADRAAIGDEAALTCVRNVFTGNAGAAAQTLFYQNIEGVRRLAGKTAIISFWAVAAAGTPKLGVSYGQDFGTGGSPSAGVSGAGQPVTLSTTWSRYSVTVSFSSVSGKTLGTNNNDSSSVQFWYSSGSTNATRAGNIGVQSGTIGIWGVQLEIGSAATPLEKPDPADDLARCQRFYQIEFFSMHGYFPGIDTLVQTFPFNVTMRALPTIVFGTASSSGNIGGAITLDAVSTGGFRPRIQTAAAGTADYKNSYTASADL